MNKKILFLTGTRADFGKLKSLIEILDSTKTFDVEIFVTGMHMQKKYGSTVNEVLNCGYSKVYTFINSTSEKSMDLTLSKTIEGLSNYTREFRPDLIIIHGDRVEALAGAIVGALNNVLVGHIEGGEISGTIDELIRHSVSKLSHLHFVSNLIAKNRLIQMGEDPKNIFNIGSPDIDIMFSNKLPNIAESKNRYEISFDNYAVVMFHPVTTEHENMYNYALNLVEVLLEHNYNLLVIYPNNDLGSNDVLKAFSKFNGHKNIKIYPSIRFEYFLVLLKNADFIIGNSSAGIREAPYYGIPTINIGTRQNNRAKAESIINCDYEKKEIDKSLKLLSGVKVEALREFGEGNSDKLFLKTLNNDRFWDTSKQKTFIEL